MTSCVAALQNVQTVFVKKVVTCSPVFDHSSVMIAKALSLWLLCGICTTCLGALYQKWARQMGTTGSDAAQAITADALGNFYVTGQVSQAFDNQSYVGGGYDIVVMKYDSNGVRQWTRITGSAGTDFGSGSKIFFFQYAVSKSDYLHIFPFFCPVAYDAKNDYIYVTGRVTGDVDGQSYLGGSGDIILLRFNPNGRKLLTSLYGTSGYDAGMAGMPVLATCFCKILLMTFLPSESFKLMWTTTKMSS